LFRLVSLHSCCIAPESSPRFFAKRSIACGLRPVTYGKPRACIFADIYKRIVLRSISQSLHAKNPRTFVRGKRGEWKAQQRAVFRQVAMLWLRLTSCAERVRRVENNRRIRVNKS
jgi:hypothetical protein